MRRLALSVLVGSVVIACGTAPDLAGSSAGASADGGAGDAAATDDAGSTSDAIATADAGALVEGGATADGSDCAARLEQILADDVPGFPSCDFSVPTGTLGVDCQLCDSAHYLVHCSPPEAGPPPAARGCTFVPVPPVQWAGSNYCCPNDAYEGAEAGAAGDGSACVNIDPSTYDRSCQTDSDCMSIASGTVCSYRCTCDSAAINADGQARYQQSVAPIAVRGCGCPNPPPPQCVQGQCVFSGASG